MKNLVNFAAFQLGWFAAVWGAAQGNLWLGSLAALAVVALHLALVQDRARELRFILAVGATGTLVDSALHNLGLIAYPTSGAWGLPLVPPWIAALWVMFATLPRFSLGWLAPYPRAAILFGAIGGPLAFWAGARLGAIAPGEGLLSYTVLALEYALLTPLMLAAARGNERAAAPDGPAPVGPGSCEPDPPDGAGEPVTH